jgi:hypothetical protein
VKEAFLCLAHAIIIAMTKVEGDLMYKSYRKVRCLKQTVQELLNGSGADLRNGEAFKELELFQNYLSYKKLLCMMV